MLDGAECRTASSRARIRLMRDAASATGVRGPPAQAAAGRDLRPDWTYDLPDPTNPAHSKRFVNAIGKQQGTCIHCGNCDSAARSTPATRSTSTTSPGAESQAPRSGRCTWSRAIEPQDGGYRVVRPARQGRAPAGRRTAVASSSPAARSARPNCCCAAATSTAPCRPSAAASATAGAPTAISSPRLLSRTQGVPDPRSDHHHGHRLSRRIGPGGTATSSRTADFPT